MNKLLYFLLIAINVLCSCRKKETPPVITKDPDYIKAKSFLHRQNDSAFYYFNRVVNRVMDSLQVANAYNYMATMQSDVGDYYGSQESLSASLKFLNAENVKHRRSLASNYNELGLTSINLRNYDAAVGFFDKAIFFTADSNFKLIYLNNKALAYQKQKDYARALEIYHAIIRKTTDKETFARILTNMATTKWLNDLSYNAAPELLSALEIRRQEQDRWGQNSSYAHLSDYYTTIRPDSAYYFALKMFDVAHGLGSPDDRLEALEKLIRVGPLQETRQFFKTYHQLSDSLLTARNAAKNQFAFIRYEVEKNKADNLTLQQDNTEKKYQLLKQQVLLYFALIVIIIGAFWYWKRKKRLEQEKQEAIRESRLRTSKKVHDVVANGLYRIMSELDHDSDLNKTALADKIEDLYEKSRDISYEKVPFSAGLFHDSVTELISSFANDSIKVVLVGNDVALWEKMSPTALFDVEHILQELMVNMRKHSRATRVAIRFERQDDKIIIYYTDNGVGMKDGVSYKNGLTNTGNRINSLQGTITFDTNIQQGLKIHLTFPVA
ncbi:ATP-binding protein [Mucilaginibacter calamicampi]|uniref:histidine kinase n=1 Tax=Mucilaginibacter calamicampi TaxID=1302352 RepID=A0ABW2YRY4_9SPHI